MITKVKEVYLVPPATLLIRCEAPYRKEPENYGDAYLRDPVWKSALAKCDEQIDRIRRWISDKQEDK